MSTPTFSYIMEAHKGDKHRVILSLGTSRGQKRVSCLGNSTEKPMSANVWIVYLCVDMFNSKARNTTIALILLTSKQWLAI